MKRTSAFAALLLIACSIADAQQKQPIRAAELYESALNELTGSAQNRDEFRGIDLIRQAARLGYAPAQTAAAFYAETREQAFDWCKKAALQGDVLGQWCVGTRYFAGNGTDRNLTLAEQWLRKSADQGNPFAAYWLGVLKLDRDPKAAAPWFQQAAEGGLPQAQRKLAGLLIEGVHAPKDKYRAYVWLLVADELDQSPAAIEGPLENDLGSAAVGKAKIEARQLAAKVSRTTTAHGCTGWEGEFDSSPSFPPVSFQKYCR